MHHDELSARERAVLFTLLSQARKLSNGELEALIGIRLEGRERRKLNELKLVESDKPGRAFVHELSDVGWQWCADELAGGPAGRASSLERAHYLMFRVFDRAMNAARLSLADLVSLDLMARPTGRHMRKDTADLQWSAARPPVPPRPLRGPWTRSPRASTGPRWRSCERAAAGSGRPAPPA